MRYYGKHILYLQRLSEFTLKILCVFVIYIIRGAYANFSQTGGATCWRKLFYTKWNVEKTVWSPHLSSSSFLYWLRTWSMSSTVFVDFPTVPCLLLKYRPAGLLGVIQAHIWRQDHKLYLFSCLYSVHISCLTLYTFLYFGKYQVLHVIFLSNCEH